MADIFISYANQDRSQIEHLARSLASEGLSIFWDVKLAAGQAYREVLSRELAESKCVIVAWSKHSVNSRWVIDEAERGLELNRLVPITIDGAIPPLGFRQIHTARVIDWHGDVSDPQYLALTSSIRRHTEMTIRPAQQAADVSRNDRPHVLKYIELSSRFFVLLLGNYFNVTICAALFFGLQLYFSLGIATAIFVTLDALMVALAFTPFNDVSQPINKFSVETDLEWVVQNIIVAATVCFISVATLTSYAALLVFCLIYFLLNYLFNYILRSQLLH
jgi:TIR domain